MAARLGLTQTAVQRAMALQRRVDGLGLTDPFVEVTEPPETAGSGGTATRGTGSTRSRPPRPRSRIG